MAVVGECSAATPTHMGLEVAKRLRAQSTYVWHPVRVGAIFQIAKTVQLSGVLGDDHLADLAVVDPVLRAVLAEQGDAPPAQPCFQRARRVVDPGVHDAGVVSRLVCRDVVLLVQDDHLTP